MNLFSAITSWIGAYNTLSQLNKPTQPTNPEISGEGMLWSTTDTRTTLQKVAPWVSNTIWQLWDAFGSSKIWQAVKKSQPIVQDIWKKLAPIWEAIVSPVKPIIENYQYGNKVNTVKKPFQEQLTKLGITAQALDEMGLSEEEKQAVIDLYSQVWVEIPWLAQMEQAKIQSQDISKNADARTGIIENAWGFINDLVGGAVSEVPKAIGNTASFLNTAAQYNPASYVGGVIGDAIVSPFSDKTYGQLRNERSKATEDTSKSIQGMWETGKKFVQKYGAYDPNSTASKVWETVTDISASLIWPNKLWVFKPWVIWSAKALLTEWALQWAKYWIASEGKIDPKQVAIWAGWNLLVWWAFKIGWKIAESLIPKSQAEKVAEAVGANYTKWTVAGKTVKVPVPNEWIIKKVTRPFRESDPKVLTGRALTPSYAWKTPKQMLKSVWEMTDNVRNFYSQVRTWKMKWSINTLEDAANTVISNLDSVGANIGTAIKWAKWTVWPSVWTMEEITSTLWNKIESRSGAFKPLQNFLEDTKWWLNLQDAFKAKKVYQAEITKLIKAGDAGTDSYQALVKWVQELTDNIDNVVEKSLGSKQLIEWKKQYRLLKSIASDISKSAVVEWRRSPQTFVEQIGTLQAITEWITSPLSTAKTIFAKEIGELNTRGGAWKELITNYDKQAIQWVQKAIIKPKKIKVWQ